MEARREASFPEIWNQCMEEELAVLHLRAEHIIILKELGNSLGQMDTRTGTGTLHLYMNRMNLEIEKTREALSSKKRLSSCMGILGGLFLVIVLI